MRFSIAAMLIVCFAPHVFAGDEEYKLGPDSMRRKGVPKGSVTKSEWHSKVFPGTVRDYWVYVPAVRKALGDRVDLLADANSCYTAPKAIEVGRLLEDYGYCHFEEPCPYWELEWTAEVAAALKIAVAGGEQDNDLAQWRRESDGC
jgi:L-alanine-DL-glutamate epimerase-like enolase superfamily enzyme